jgi:hypothetical protein
MKPTCTGFARDAVPLERIQSEAKRDIARVDKEIRTQSQQAIFQISQFDQTLADCRISMQNAFSKKLNALEATTNDCKHDIQTGLNTSVNELADKVITSLPGTQWTDKVSNKYLQP